MRMFWRDLERSLPWRYQQESMSTVFCANGQKRRFGFFPIFGFTCTVLITWEGSLMHVLIRSSSGYV